MPTPAKTGHTFLGWSKENNSWTKNYQPVEYIESTGTQYIDTGISANDVSTIKLKFSIAKYVNDIQGIIGGGWSANNKTFQIVVNGSNNKLNVRYGDNLVDGIADNNNIHNFVLSKDRIVYDDGEQYKTTLIEDNRNVVIFARLNDNGVTRNK